MVRAKSYHEPTTIREGVLKNQQCNLLLLQISNSHYL